jgi:glycosyltransferase involved in cell wall biosynthesis
VQRRGSYFVFNELDSDRLFQILADGPVRFRRRFVAFAARAFFSARRFPVKKGLLYLNVGHTGLNEPSLGSWISTTQVRAIFFIHDLIPILHPEFCRPGEKIKHERRIESAIRNAAGIIGNSKTTLGDIQEFAVSRGLKMPTAKAAWISGPPVLQNVKPKTFDRPHFIAVGTIEGRKNYELLLNVWKKLVARDPATAPLLMIVGQRGWEADAAIAMLDHPAQFKGRVVELGQCRDEKLAALIAGARALLMPSFTEGFGLPVVEALELGTPVVASNLAVFHEIAGEIPTYLDCLDAQSWEGAVLSFAADGAERQRQLKLMPAYQAPDWTTHFKTVDAWIETLVQ